MPMLRQTERKIAVGQRSYSAVLPSFAVGSWSLAAVWPPVLNVFCDFSVLATPAGTGGGIKSPSNLTAGHAAF